MKKLSLTEATVKALEGKLKLNESLNDMIVDLQNITLEPEEDLTRLKEKLEYIKRLKKPITDDDLYELFGDATPKYIDYVMEDDGTREYFTGVKEELTDAINQAIKATEEEIKENKSSELPNKTAKKKEKTYEYIFYNELGVDAVTREDIKYWMEDLKERFPKLKITKDRELNVYVRGNYDDLVKLCREEGQDTKWIEEV